MSNIHRALLYLEGACESPESTPLTQEIHCNRPGESQRITFELASSRNASSFRFQPACEPVLIELLDVIAVTESSREISPDYQKSNALWESGTQYLFDTGSSEILYTFPDDAALTSITFRIAYRSSGDELRLFIVERLKEINRKREADCLNLAKANDELKKTLFLQMDFILEEISRGTVMERLNTAAKILFPRGTALRKILAFFSKRFKGLDSSARRTDRMQDACLIPCESPPPAGTIENERDGCSSAALTALLQRSRKTPLRETGKTPNDRAAFTIVSKNHLARALALRDSFQAFNRDCDFIIFLADLASDRAEIELLSILIGSGVDIRCVHELGRFVPYRNFGHMLLRYNVLEANRAFRPFCIDYLMRSSYQKIIYLDSDTLVTGPFSECYSLLDSFSMILAPNILEPFRDDTQMRTVISEKGAFSPGFLALRKSEETKGIIEWWEDRAYSHGHMTGESDRVNECLCMELFTSFCRDLHIIRDRGCNAAGWNLHERPVWRREGHWNAGSDRLIFFHFSGCFSDAATVELPGHCSIDDENSGIKGLFNDYGEMLREYSSLLPEDMNYYYSRLPFRGCLIRDEQRGAAAEKHVHVDVNPFIQSSGIEKALCDELPVTESIERDGTPDKKEDFIKESAGLTLAGHFSSIAGISQIARSFAANLFSTAIPFTLHNSHLMQHPEIELQSLARFSECFSDELPYRLVLLFINCDEILNSLRAKCEMLSSDYHRAAVWWWEFESGFEPFMKGFDHIDELLVFNDFLRDFYTSIAPRHIRIHKLLCPFMPDWTVTEPQEAIRKRYGIMNDEYVFFFHFDCFSSIRRKNPGAVIRSFAQVFRGKRAAKLVIKMNNASLFAVQVKELTSLIHELGVDEKVVITDEPLPRNELMSLINATDCYVSLHRGEGMGLGILEAMALGKPVICTAYGGNMEFTNSGNSLLVDYAMVDAKPDIEVYRCVRQWAEPSTDQAAEYMSCLSNDRDLSRKTGDKARQFVRSYFSPERSVLDILNYVKDRL
jgi:glycosyltransferase involved in cell wall biosynthesis